MKTKSKASEKTNITLKLDRALLKEIKIIAAKRDTSISNLLNVQIEEFVKKQGGFEERKRRAVERMRKGFDLGFTPAKSRDELHER